ncbi:hypothetical protein [Paenibacillus sp. RC84]|uniref:hypothetical protein n=1 Tax=Paenibacillus sp. RC84 TaxID=3156252 RepID=UPI003512A754
MFRISSFFKVPFLIMYFNFAILTILGTFLGGDHVKRNWGLDELPDRIERLIRTAILTYEEQFFQATLGKLPLASLSELDSLVDSIAFLDEDQGGFARPERGCVCILLPFGITSIKVKKSYPPNSGGGFFLWDAFASGGFQEAPARYQSTTNSNECPLLRISRRFYT